MKRISLLFTLSAFGVVLAFVPLGAGLMIVVAAFTRSNREAQSWLSVVMFLPMTPILYAVADHRKISADR